MTAQVVVNELQPYLSSGDFSAKARSILEKKIEAGRASAQYLFEVANTKMPKDAIVKGKALEFRSNGPMTPFVEVAYGAEQGIIHKHALGQLAQRAGVPDQYLGELANGSQLWQRNLAAEILNRHYHDGAADERYLVRAVDGQVRGVMSDRYRRLDSRPLLERFAEKCQAVGAVPIDGTVTDTRFALKAILPTVFEPIPGEVMALGIEWSNSDYGAGLHAVRAFIFRLWCSNGATMENALAQVHLGGRLADDIEFSRSTYALDTRTSVSALGDVIDGTLGAKKIVALLEGIKGANAKGVEWKNVKSGLQKKLLKSELKAAEDAFESEDVINLPEGKSLWRVSNAISWLAGKSEDSDRKLELQRLAGSILGKEDAQQEAA